MTLVRKTLRLSVIGVAIAIANFFGFRTLNRPLAVLNAERNIAFSSEQQRVSMKNAKYIAHAFGAISGHGYLDCLECFEFNYDRGFRYFEVDLFDTPDKKVVAFHDGQEKRFNLSVGFTHDQFMNASLDGYTPLDMDRIATLMKERQDWFMVTDIKTGNDAGLKRICDTLTSASLDCTDRVIPQLYAPSELPTVKSLGFKRNILTLYRYGFKNANATKRMALEFLANNSEISALTIPWARLDNEYASSTAALGVALYVHTLNRPVDVQMAFKNGVTGIYTDAYNPSPTYEIRSAVTIFGPNGGPVEYGNTHHISCGFNGALTGFEFDLKVHRNKTTEVRNLYTCIQAFFDSRTTFGNTFRSKETDYGPSGTKWRQRNSLDTLRAHKIDCEDSFVSSWYLKQWSNSMSIVYVCTSRNSSTTRDACVTKETRKIKVDLKRFSSLAPFNVSCQKSWALIHFQFTGVAFKFTCCPIPGLEEFLTRTTNF